MEKNPVEASSHSARHEIPHRLWNMKIRYRVHKTSHPVRNISHINIVHNRPLYFLEDQFKLSIAACLRLRVGKCCFTFGAFFSRCLFRATAQPLLTFHVMILIAGQRA